MDPTLTIVPTELVEIFEHEIKVNGSFRKQAFQGYAKDFSLLVAGPAQNDA
jgi:hypothetical protein